MLLHPLHIGKRIKETRSGNLQTPLAVSTLLPSGIKLDALRHTAKTFKVLGMLEEGYVVVAEVHIKVGGTLDTDEVETDRTANIVATTDDIIRRDNRLQLTVGKMVAVDIISHAQDKSLFQILLCSGIAKTGIPHDIRRNE